MQTVFFIKKRWLYIAANLFFSIFVFSICVYAAFIREIKAVWIGKSFYFLFSNTTNVEVGAWESLQKGGAGYILEYENTDRVVLSIYLKEADGLAVQTSLWKETQLLPINVGYIYFKTQKEKTNAAQYCTALDNLYGCIQVLEQTTAGLENGATQQSTLRTLSILQKQLQYLEKRYAKTYAEFTKICKNAQIYLQECLPNTLYIKDLRYLLCDLTVGYISLTKAFSL